MGLKHKETKSGPFHVDGAKGSDISLQNSTLPKGSKFFQIQYKFSWNIWIHSQMKNLWVNEIARCDYLPKYGGAFVSESPLYGWTWSELNYHSDLILLNKTTFSSFAGRYHYLNNLHQKGFSASWGREIKPWLQSIFLAFRINYPVFSYGTYYALSHPSCAPICLLIVNVCESKEISTWDIQIQRCLVWILFLYLSLWPLWNNSFLLSRGKYFLPGGWITQKIINPTLVLLFNVTIPSLMGLSDPITPFPILKVQPQTQINNFSHQRVQKQNAFWETMDAVPSDWLNRINSAQSPQNQDVKMIMQTDEQQWFLKRSKSCFE